MISIYLISFCLADGHSFLALVAELLAGGCELLLGKVVNGETLDDGPFAILDGDGEGKHDALGGAVRAVGEDAHGHKPKIGVVQV